MLCLADQHRSTQVDSTERGGCKRPCLGLHGGGHAVGWVEALLPQTGQCWPPQPPGCMLDPHPGVWAVGREEGRGAVASSTQRHSELRPRPFISTPDSGVHAHPTGTSSWLKCTEWSHSLTKANGVPCSPPWGQVSAGVEEEHKLEGGGARVWTWTEASFRSYCWPRLKVRARGIGSGTPTGMNRSGRLM